VAGLLRFFEIKIKQYASNRQEIVEIKLLKMLCQENKRLIYNYVKREAVPLPLKRGNLYYVHTK